jgi:hypothetical protein
MSDQTKLSLSELESYRNQQGKPAGKYLRFYCPIHGGDHQRSLALNPTTGHFICFACGAWGYIEEKKQEWMEELKRNNEWKYQKPCKNFGERKMITKPPDEKKAAAQNIVQPNPEPPARLELNDILVELQHALPKSLGEKYLDVRKIPIHIAQEYGTGYAAYGKWPHLKDGRPVRQWKSGRIVFPHTNPKGEVVNLYGRAVEMGEPVPKEFKHDHLPGMKGVFNAKALTAAEVFICEGCFNALSLITVGYRDACAIFGVDGLRWEWITARRIVFCLDQDKAGENWKKFAWEAVLRGKEAFWLPPEVYGGYKDLNEVWMATGKLDIGDGQKSASPQDSSQSPTRQETPVPPISDWREEMKSWPAELQEAWEERAAIRYFDGCLGKEEAERLAFEDIKRQIDRK